MLSAAKLLKKRDGTRFCCKIFQKGRLRSDVFYLLEAALCATFFFYLINDKTQSQRDFHNENVALAAKTENLSNLPNLVSRLFCRVHLDKFFHSFPMLKTACSAVSSSII